jgi:hypothetical protein
MTEAMVGATGKQTLFSIADKDGDFPERSAAKMAVSQSASL